ncbi:MAG TPA: hypothetical protein VFX12_11735 [Vicinamibacterales bacterium]|nr:hypothetical protein [Vicinamibacterales bacterium]
MVDDRVRLGRTVRRLPLLAIGMLSMAGGLWFGLIRLGWALPLPRPDQLIVHGPLMVGGFLGTLICLERAVGLGRRWAYAAPVLTAAGAICLLADTPVRPAAALITLGSLGLIAIFLVVCRRQPTLFSATLALGAAAWFVGNARWCHGASIYRAVPWWMAFLVLTIAGERLELNRVLRPARGVRAVFVAAIGVTLAGSAITFATAPFGIRVLGGGLVLLAAWLLRYDIARRTVRARALTRYMGAALLAGYVWLAIGGALMLATGTLVPGTLYDATLHAVFLGFVMSMIFAHAPVIFPAVLGVHIAYRPSFYSHLAVLHASLVVRVVGDLVPALGAWRAWGGLFNAVALVLFVVNTVAAFGVKRHPVAVGVRGYPRAGDLG